MSNFHHLLLENGLPCNSPTVLSDIAESSKVEVFSLYFGVEEGVGHFLPLISALIFTSQATCIFLIPLVSEKKQLMISFVQICYLLRTS